MAAEKSKGRAVKRASDELQLKKDIAIEKSKQRAIKRAFDEDGFKKGRAL